MVPARIITSLQLCPPHQFLSAEMPHQLRVNAEIVLEFFLEQYPCIKVDGWLGKPLTWPALHQFLLICLLVSAICTFVAIYDGILQKYTRMAEEILSGVSCLTLGSKLQTCHRSRTPCSNGEVVKSTPIHEFPIDVAHRNQYIFHIQWRRRRDQYSTKKF